MAFIDEGGESVGRYNKLMNQCATRGRHWGHTVHIIAQDATQIAPIVRAQCTKLFAFAQSRAAGELLAREWLHDDLELACKLKRREYMYAVKMGGISIHRSESNGTLVDNRRTRNDGSGNTGGDKTPAPKVQEASGQDTSGGDDSSEQHSAS